MKPIYGLDNGGIGHKLLEGDDVIGSSGFLKHEGIVLESYFDGSAIFTNKWMNKLLLVGRTFILEKANNARSAFVPVPMDQELGVCTSGDIDLSLANLKNEEIIGFVVGVGGSGDTRNTIYEVQPHHKNVPLQVPFRVIDTAASPDLTGTERAQYFLRKQVGNIVYYYGKIVTSKTIKTLFSNGVEVPADVHSQTNPGEILNYIEYQLDISAKDIREYFIQTEGNTINSRFNSIGLVTGYPITLPGGAIEYRNVRCNTTLNIDTRDLKDSLSTATYRYQYLVK